MMILVMMMMMLQLMMMMMMSLLFFSVYCCRGWLERGYDDSYDISDADDDEVIVFLCVLL